jgi:hypothetical protein
VKRASVAKWRACEGDLGAGIEEHHSLDIIDVVNANPFLL